MPEEKDKKEMEEVKEEVNAEEKVDETKVLDSEEVIEEGKVELDIDKSEIPMEEPVKPEEIKEVRKVDTSGWNPKTEIGNKVKSGEITSLGEIKDKGIRILEPEIIEVLLPDLETDLLLIGQAKGKFGGGQRRVFRQTQKKTREGNKPSFAAFAVVGNNNGFVGVGYGKSKETVPAREKALRNAKLNVMQIKRACGSWECGCKEPHSIPFEVLGKCGSVRIKLMPAPKGTGLCAEPEIQKILRLAGINDIWSKTYGNTKTKINLIKACTQALQKLISMKVQTTHEESLGIVKGDIKK